MIEKRMFFYWGNKELSWMRYLTLYSFRKLNPNWEVTLFLTDLDYEKRRVWKDGVIQDFHNFTGEDYFRKILDLDIRIHKYHFSDQEKEAGPTYRSNFFKWKILSEFSGYYSDLDILYTKPIDDFYEESKEFNTIICHNGKYFSIGLLGSSGENKFFTDVYDASLESYTSNYYQSAGVNSLLLLIRKLTGNNTLTLHAGMDIFKQEYPKISFYNFPMNLVYPWTCTKMREVFERKYEVLPENCIGIHWYAGAHITQKYNNILNEKNYQYFDSTFCHWVKKLYSVEKEGPPCFPQV